MVTDHPDNPVKCEAITKPLICMHYLVYEKILGMIGRGGIKVYTNSLGKVFFLPWPIIICLVIYLVFWFILKKTSLGRHIYAIGQMILYIFSRAKLAFSCQ